MIRELKRLQITFFKTLYEELLADIDKANKDLRDFTHQNINLEPIRVKRQSKRQALNLRMTRNRARSLHNVIITDSVWKCRCQTCHVISLRRERFRMLVSKEITHQDKSIKEAWQEFEWLSIIEDKSPSVHPDLPQPKKR